MLIIGMVVGTLVITSKNQKQLADQRHNDYMECLKRTDAQHLGADTEWCYEKFIAN